MIYNTLAEPIMKKNKRHDFKAWKLKRKVIKLIKTSVLSFDFLEMTYQFLEIIRECYMYGNDEQFHLFLATVPKGKGNYNAKAMVYRDSNFSITFILNTINRVSTDGEDIEVDMINLEISRGGQTTKNDKERIFFEDGRYKFTDEYDKEKFLYIEICIRNAIIELVDYFYKNKKL